MKDLTVMWKVSWQHHGQRHDLITPHPQEAEAAEALLALNKIPAQVYIAGGATDIYPWEFTWIREE